MKSRQRQSSRSNAVFGPYQAPDGVYDEMRDSKGGIRPAWGDYITPLENLGVEDLVRRWSQADHLIQENGVTYNIYGDPSGRNRPWDMDPIPEIIAPADWAVLEKGLQQRAHLLNLLLADVYGPQRLIADGILSPEFLFANAGFLRPCHGVNVTGGIFLHLYAADLIRGPDGRWRVIADQTQTPSGAGYSLENRIVLSRIMPDILRDCRVQRLATFFDRLRSTLRAIAPTHRDAPSIVLLTPGPSHETYFEHSYLARYLGYTLAEGEDLTVRDNNVYLKTLDGLQRVDVIMRRLEDHLCDPLEFYTQSTPGIVGLLQAVHSGSVIVANALGSGMLEIPALRAILPSLCRHLLGEELKLESVPTWWCGNAEHRNYIGDHFNDLVVVPAFTPRDHEPIFVANLSTGERRALRNRIDADPASFAAQAHVRPSTVPVWAGTNPQPRSMVLRAFAAANSSRLDSYHVMSGGLTRFAIDESSLVVAMQRGGGSKDTWVRTDGAVDTLSLLPPPGQALDIVRALSSLPSRAADNLFWMGRYVERAEAVVRKIRAVLTRLTDEPGATSSPDFSDTLRVLLPALPASAAANLKGPSVDAAEVEWAIFTAVFDEQWKNSVVSLLGVLHRVASVVRDRLSLDTWRIVGRLTETTFGDTSGNVDFVASNRTLSDVLVLLNQVITGLAAFSGLATENMTRSQGWRFLDIGRRIERSMQTLELLQSCLVAPSEHEAAVLQPVLEIADSSMTYRSRYETNLQAPAVLDLVLTDESNPRAVVFQIQAVSDHLEQLPRPKTYPFVSVEQQIIARVLSDFRALDIYALCAPDEFRRRSRLDAQLSTWFQLLPEASDALASHFFSHTGASKQLSSLRTDSHT